MALAHITLACPDPDRSAAFFGATLGWLPIERPTNNAVPTSWVQIAPGQELHLVQVPEFEASPFEREYGRHIAVTFPRSGFEDLKRRLTAQGAVVIDPLRSTTFARFFFRNPDGYLFEVIEEERQA